MNKGSFRKPVPTIYRTQLHENIKDFNYADSRHVDLNPPNTKALPPLAEPICASPISFARKLRSGSSSANLRTYFLPTNPPHKDSFALKCLHLKDLRFESTSLIFENKDLESNADSHRKYANKH